MQVGQTGVGHLFGCARLILITALFKRWDAGGLDRGWSSLWLRQADLDGCAEEMAIRQGLTISLVATCGS